MALGEATSIFQNSWYIARDLRKDSPVSGGSDARPRAPVHQSKLDLHQISTAECEPCNSQSRACLLPCQHIVQLCLQPSMLTNYGHTLAAQLFGLTF